MRLQSGLRRPAGTKVTRAALALVAAAVVATAALLFIADSAATREPARPSAPAFHQVASTAPLASARPAASATANLSAALLSGAVRDSSSGNAVISSYSIEQALAMLAQGAKGATAAQLLALLDASSVKVAGQANVALLAALQRTTSTAAAAGGASGQPQLLDANSLWLQTGLTVKPAFLSALQTSFGTELQRANFATASEAAREQLNRWVAAETRNHIQNLFPAGSISPETELVLANALYLKAHWANQFDPALTSAGRFYTAGGAVSTASFMTFTDSEWLAIAGNRDYTAVQLPYAHSTLSMLLLMPRTEKLADFNATLSAARLHAIVAGLRTRSVELLLPKLKLSFHTELTQQLKALGVTDVFSSAANLSGIAGRPGDLSVSAVEHAAVLQLDEAGTVAAAATGVVMVGAAAHAPVPTLDFNHPFLALIRDSRSGAVLFSAAVGDPAAG